MFTKITFAYKSLRMPLILAQSLNIKFHFCKYLNKDYNNSKLRWKTLLPSKKRLKMNQKLMNLRLDKELHKRFKIYCITHDTYMSKVLINYIENLLGDDKS